MKRPKLGGSPYILPNLLTTGNLFFGFYVHHRSGIFASANLYGNVYGGSNVNALYLEWEFGR